MRIPSLLPSSAAFVLCLVLAEGYTQPSTAGRIPRRPAFASSVSQQPRNRIINNHPRQSRLSMVGHIFEEPTVNAFGIPTTTVSPYPELSPMETYCLVRLEELYSKALERKCPFLRRRMTDFIETIEMLIRTVIIQPQNLPLVGPTLSCRGDSKTRTKTKGLARTELLEVIRGDWKEDSQKGYYVTGRLTPAIYRDDCFFDGPDPDMPVKGLRKFLGAASQLFAYKTSTAELLSLHIVGDVIKAKWKFNGTIRIPHWHPRLPEVMGETVYHFDEDGLIHLHEETWDLSAVQAFVKTAWFGFRSKLNKEHDGGHH